MSLAKMAAAQKRTGKGEGWIPVLFSEIERGIVPNQKFFPLTLLN
jgi:hypothetical protein